MSTQALLLAELRARVAALATARDPAANFVEYEGNLAFEASPMSGADGFQVELGASTPLEAFGNPGAYRVEQVYVVKLGHFGGGTNIEREVWRIADVLSVRELEFYAWASAGVVAVFWEAQEVDKDDPAWWVSRVTFRAHLTENRAP